MTTCPRQSGKVTPVLQGAYAECGVACVVMILKAHGVDTSLSKMAERWACGVRAITMRSLLEMLEAHGMVGRPLRAELSALDQVACPAILHWNFDHYVVLERVDRRFLYVVDPAIGRRRIPLSEASHCFTGIVLEASQATPPAPTTGPREPSPLRALLPNWTSVLGQSLPFLALTCLVNAVMLLLPLFQKVGFERIIPAHDLSQLDQIALLFVSIAVAHFLMQLVRVRHLSVLRAKLTRLLSSNLFNHLIWARPQFFEARPASRIAHQYQAVQSISSTLTEQVLANGIDVVFVILGAALLITLSPTIGLVVLGALLVYFAIQLRCMNELGSRLANSIQAEMTENGFVFETIESMPAVRIYAAELSRLATWRNVHEDVSQAQSAYWNYRNSLAAAQELIVNITWLMTIYLAMRSHLSGGLTLGLVAATASWASFVLTRARDVGQGVLAATLFKTHVARVEDVVRAPKGKGHVENLVKDTAACLSAQPLGLEAVAFRYDDFSPWVLSDCSLQVDPGSFVAITGGSGSGKTTLTKLLLGLQEPHAGVVTAGSLRGADASALIRRDAGVVMQNDVLNSGSILDNISFFAPDPDLNLARECAKISGAHAFIESLPMKYGAVVGRRGLGLSAGQVQRILLARALYREPKVLMLDEFSSNLDEALERDVLANLKAMPMTIIAVAHRPQVIDVSTHIYELKDGQLLRRPAQSPAPRRTASVRPSP